MSKPCEKCPWTQRARPDITPEVLEAGRSGMWFCCHVNMGTCYGAQAEHKRAIKEAANG